MTPARRPSAGRPALGPAKRRRYTVHLTPTMADEVEQQAAIAGIAPGRLLARIVEAQLVGAKRARGERCGDGSSGHTSPLDD